MISSFAPEQSVVRVVALMLLAGSFGVMRGTVALLIVCDKHKSHSHKLVLHLVSFCGPTLPRVLGRTVARR